MILFNLEKCVKFWKFKQPSKRVWNFTLSLNEMYNFLTKYNRKISIVNFWLKHLNGVCWKLKVEKCSQDLENEVIYAVLCIHCGSCNAFCPHMDFNQDNGEAYVVDVCTETVGLCYNACPRT